MKLNYALTDHGASPVGSIGQGLWSTVLGHGAVGVQLYFLEPKFQSVFRTLPGSMR